MAVTLAKIERDIFNIATSGSNPDDFRIQPRQLYFWTDEIRSTLISQAIQKRQDITDVWIQTLSCIEMIDVDKSECCLTESDCKVRRSKLKIPRTVEFDGDNLIIAVIGAEGKTISKYNKHSSRYKKFRKYTSEDAGWMLKDDYLYILDDDFLNRPSIWGIFESPWDLNSFSCCDKPCFDENSDYPVSAKMASTITDIIIKTKVLPLMQFPRDDSNDSNSTNSNIVK